MAAVGIYAPSRLWEQLAGEQVNGRPAAPVDPAAATLKDDTDIIVVLDSSTGEVRQCGNLSGVCIGMNPWTKALAAGRRAPAALSKHEADLEQEDLQEPGAGSATVRGAIAVSPKK